MCLLTAKYIPLCDHTTVLFYFTFYLERITVLQVVEKIVQTVPQSLPPPYQWHYLTDQGINIGTI